ncbi:MAG: hypothetical protein ACI9AR_000502 [Flavobacteriaceae bacterium]|jgi:hypothetical protein
MHKSSYRGDKEKQYRIATIVCILLSILFLVSFIRFFPKIQESKKNKIQAQLEYEELRLQEEELYENVDYINSDDGREDIIRQKYGLAQSGESVVILVNDVEEVEEIKKEKRGFFSFLRRLFSSK